MWWLLRIKVANGLWLWHCPQNCVLVEKKTKFYDETSEIWRSVFVGLDFVTIFSRATSSSSSSPSFVARLFLVLHHDQQQHWTKRWVGTSIPLNASYFLIFSIYFKTHKTFLPVTVIRCLFLLIDRKLGPMRDFFLSSFRSIFITNTINCLPIFFFESSTDRQVGFVIDGPLYTFFGAQFLSTQWFSGRRSFWSLANNSVVILTSNGKWMNDVMYKHYWMNEIERTIFF